MQLYSVGFLHNDTEMVLIRKNRPEWQYGLFNGVGGHIEDGETPRECMVREFKEETGVYVPSSAWDHAVSLIGPEAQVFVFAAYDTGNWISKTDTITDEEVVRVEFSRAWQGVAVENLSWLVPLIRQRGKYETPLRVQFHGDA